MILRRLAEAITEQNWVTVVLEVLIVVVGIFIGLQVDDWNQGRKDALLEQEYLERLWTDFNHNRDVLEEAALGYAERSEDGWALVRYLLQEEENPEMHAAVSEKGFRGFVYPSLALAKGTYDELNSTGRLTLLRDAKLLNELQAIIALYRGMEGQLNYFRTGYMSLNDTFPQRGIFSLDSEGGITRALDFRHVRGNQGYIDYVAGQASSQGKFRRYRAAELERTLAFIQTLACRLGKEECAAEAEASDPAAGE